LTIRKESATLHLMAEEKSTEKGYGYGKRPLWQWIVLYLVIGGIVYAAIYYFVLSKNGGYNYGASMQNTEQSGQDNYTD
jgi:hypothetical protein